MNHLCCRLHLSSSSAHFKVFFNSPYKHKCIFKSPSIKEPFHHRWFDEVAARDVAFYPDVKLERNAHRVGAHYAQETKPSPSSANNSKISGHDFQFTFCKTKPENGLITSETRAAALRHAVRSENQPHLSRTTRKIHGDLRHFSHFDHLCVKSLLRGFVVTCLKEHVRDQHYHCW